MGRGNFAIDCGLGARQAALDNQKKRGLNLSLLVHQFKPKLNHLENAFV